MHVRLRAHVINSYQIRGSDKHSLVLLTLCIAQLKRLPASLNGNILPSNSVKLKCVVTYGPCGVAGPRGAQFGSLCRTASTYDYVCIRGGP
jgi:hypothetical protein